MKKLFGLLVALMSFAHAASADQTLPNLASQVANQVQVELQQCGLSLVDPRTPGLPFPRYDATYAVLGRYGQALAYFVQSYGGVANWRWMNPNGSYAHSIQFNNDSIRFVTPYNGNVASASRVFSPAGVGFNLYCRQYGNVYNWQVFQQCINQEFVRVITSQLCR